MRVAITFHGVHRRGGVERVALECVNFMASRGHEVHAFAREFEPDGILPSVRLHRLEYPASPKYLALPRYRRAITAALSRLEAPPDVVAGFGAGAPPGSVVWMQSVHAQWLQISRGSRDLPERVRQRANPFHPVVLTMERRQLRRREYAKIIALTPSVKSDIVRRYGVPPGDIAVVPNGYSRSEFYVHDEAQRNDMRAALGYQPGDRVVVFVANELERKGFAPLVEAIARLADADVHLLAVGRLDERQAMAQARRWGLADRLKLVGPTSTVARYYAAADVFALPTKYEAWGLVIVEAMACGLPVLTSSLAGASEAVRPGFNGELVDDPADVAALASRLSSLLHARHAARADIAESMRDYEWSRVLEQFERILLDSATPPGGKPTG